MPRVKGGIVTRRRHKKILKMAKGFTGARSKIFRRANEAILKSLAYAYRDRRNRKREIRSLWIARINAAARANGISYSRLMDGLKKAGVEINRKMIADMAVNDAAGFEELVRVARESTVR
ncbi:MAG TPA: 50S ribosomal protein L20 [Firmicutes bacterium]|nr:50S ribosomal protein L20 [Bacillota bacterium]HHY99388.1 50S ribosomal protein L20 [Bacillota bacterium]